MAITLSGNATSTFSSGITTSAQVQANDWTGTVSDTGTYPALESVFDRDDANDQTFGMIRYADGTQICWHNRIDRWSASGTDVQVSTWAFEKDFLYRPVVILTVRCVDDNSSYFADVSSRQIQVGSTQVIARKQQSDGTMQVSGIAIGRWKA